MVVKIRPDVTQRGQAMIGDFRTDALHQALDNEKIPNETLIGLLVLALAGRNVTVLSTDPYGFQKRETIRDRITEGGVLTADHPAIHAAARAMLKHVLSCRANMTDSGISARIAGQALGASDLLPSMATEEFLSCLSRQALERSAAAEGVRVEVRVKDTRAALITRCKDGTWRFPGALFALTPEERAEGARQAQSANGGAGGISPEEVEEARDLPPEDGSNIGEEPAFLDAAD
ncbi:MAG: hypothetical protein JOZ05_13970 [Acetobacteraceae bacterium]|nr:hypothetical protein [Acetobacteraceae bacterium]